MSVSSQKPMDKENSTLKLKNKNENGIKIFNELMNTPLNINKRRALGDVKNIQKLSNNQQKLNDDYLLSKQTLNLNKQCKNQQNIILKTNDDIEFNQSINKFDSFNDILNDKQKLSNIFINSKCVPILPSGEFTIYCDDNQYDDKFHSFNVISDKKLKKSIKKQAKSIMKSTLDDLTSSQPFEINFIDENLFVPPSDW